MNKIKLLKSKINSGNFPRIYPHFGGANLIITDKPDRKFYENDIVVYSEHASALSWLVVELKLIYDSDLNHINKYSFYPYIGELINQTLTKQELLFETMLIVVDQIEQDWGEL